MKLKSNQPKATAEQVVKDIRRATRRHYEPARVLRRKVDPTGDTLRPRKKHHRQKF